MPVRPMRESRGTRRWARRVRWLVVSFALTMVLTACVVIPYKPGSETTNDLSEVPNPERIRLTVGPRQFLDAMAKDVLERDKRLQRIDGQTFIDTASPTQELTLARMLDPSTRELIEPLQADYLVLCRKPEDATLESFGGGAPLAALGKSKVSTTYWAAVIDLRQLRVVEQLESKSVGTVAGVWVFYGVFIEGDTQASAQQGLVRHVVATIASDRPTGPVSLVFLADEPIPTAEEVAQESRKREVLPARWSVDGYPAFTAAAPPNAGHGLIYIYRPYKPNGRFLALDIHTRPTSAGAEITQLWSGGYFPFYAPVGVVTVWLEPEGTFASEGTQSVTMDVRPGATYYVKGSTAFWAAPHRRLEVVGSGNAMRDMKKCRLLPSAESTNLETRKLAEEGYIERQFELGALYSTRVTYPDGSSLPRDPVEAYKWFSIATQDPESSSAWRTLAIKSRDSLAADMDAAQIAQAEQRARDWTEAHPKPP